MPCRAVPCPWCEQYLKKRYNVIANYAIGNAPTADEATAISDSLLASYLAGDCDRVELL